nr:beta-phosphoglucomutase [Thomasclavelia sp.]
MTVKKGLVFDLDGVITDTAKFHYIAWKELGESIGIEVDLEFNEQLKGISRMDSLDRILVHGGKENDYTTEEKEEMAASKNANYVKLLDDLTPNDLLPGVKDFLDQAKERKIPCSLASASKNAPFILKKLGVFEYFDAIVDPATLKKGKPDPEIFIKAAELIGLDPAEAIGFEDAKAGIEGIKGANMYAIGVEGHEPLTGADMTIKSFEELDIDQLMNV